MGMDFEGAGGHFRWTSSGWRTVLELAESGGWVPLGTGPPRGVRKGDWTGGYYSNDGQRVYARDARRLADALEQALADTSSEANNDVYREFIAYCRAGSFRLF